MSAIDNLSDEEIANMTEEQFAALAGNAAQADSTEEGETKTDEVKVETKDEVVAEAEEADDSDKGESQDIAAVSDEDKDETEVKEVTDAKAPAKEAKDEVKTETKSTDVNYEEVYKELFAPIKANGRTFKPESVDDIKQLMQMGLGFHKKMAAFKPHQATILMLEKAGIKEADLNFLIDVHQRVPAAINKLVKDSGIDPMDLSVEKADAYKQSNHRPGDNEVDLEFVLQDLKDSPNFDKTAQVISGLDKASRALVNEHPEILKIVHGNIETGVYDQIMDKVESERALGRLSGLSDLEAYRQVGASMVERKEFAQQEAGQPPRQQTKTAPAVVQPKPKQAEDSKRKEAKQAAMPTKVAATAAEKTPVNALALSDEEFANLKF